MGLQAEGVEDGTQAMEALHLGKYDVLAIDLVLPGTPALEVIRDARRVHPEQQAIVLASNPSVDMAVQALRAGADEFLLKPLESLTDFDAALSRLLRNCERRRESIRLLEEMQRLAVTDPLTGLFNRRRLADALEREIDRARRYDRDLSLVMIDLDNLKHINDTQGHQAGDQVLIDAAKAISSGARKSDLVIRYGGDEFMILLVEADMKASMAVAKRICSRIALLSTKETKLSASAGVVLWDHIYATPAAFIRAVDKMLYDAKASGRGRLRNAVPIVEANVPQEALKEA
jgi:two-component system cell cycle response regulator